MRSTRNLILVQSMFSFHCINLWNLLSDFVKRISYYILIISPTRITLKWFLLKLHMNEHSASEWAWCFWMSIVLLNEHSASYQYHMCLLLLCFHNNKIKYQFHFQNNEMTNILSNISLNSIILFLKTNISYSHSYI